MSVWDLQSYFIYIIKQPIKNSTLSTLVLVKFYLHIVYKEFRSCRTLQYIGTYVFSSPYRFWKDETTISSELEWWTESLWYSSIKFLRFYIFCLHDDKNLSYFIPIWKRTVKRYKTMYNIKIWTYVLCILRCVTLQWILSV